MALPTTTKAKDITHEVDYQAWIGKRLRITTHDGIERKGECTGVQTCSVPYVGRSGPMDLVQLVAVEFDHSSFDAVQFDRWARIEEIRE